MTREYIAREIDFVDSIMQSHFNDYGEETHRALQEAVKLIEQEPKADGDWISRQAIEKLKKYRFNYDTNTTIPKSDLFVKLVDIKELSSVKQEPNTDNRVKTELDGVKTELGNCISRTELLSRIDAERKHLLEIKMDGAEHIIVHHARRIIEDMPSVTPQPKIRHWIDIDAETYTWKIRCDKCGHERSMMSTQGHHPKFCEECGVDMRESEKNVCKDCYYNDGEVHAECVICDRAESEDTE